MKHGAEKSVQPLPERELLPSPRPLVMPEEAPPPGEDAGLTAQEQAIQEAHKLKAELPGARPIKAGNDYLVVLGNAPANETDALLAAARAKKDAVVNAVNPVLVEVKR